jgi:hypothetical protein
MAPILGILASGISGNLWQPGKDFDSIATITPYTTTTTVTFSSIPSTYKHLQIRWFARGSSLAGLYWTFNGDSGANYARHRLSADGSSASAAGLASQNNIYTVASWGIPNAANTFAGGVYDILDYKDTNKYSTLRGLAGQDSNGSGGVELVSGLWMNTAAINSITISPNVGTIQANSHWALYGIKG